ncbi:polyisoprenoid-binding protein [Spirosoma sp. HMF3257]|uniref:Polyisoprenoid-binding protein n=1 Tax=Spirosoma telluris TaxID=2183553 RepID=A0A327NSC8_9BACT|nr:polyisoprenoid-binding protein [Spirosoma telluris]RAI78291.1 polyisoprenoid-binding protein [Spirosoma telluris]
MKSLVFTVATLLSLSTAYAQTWGVDKAHSGVAFTVTHNLLSEVDGKFKTFDAKITSAKPDLSDAVFELTADVNSISTENERRDGHLKSPDFFDAAKYPTVTFKSTSFKKVEGKKYKLMGDLTMHGVTKPVALDVTMNGPVAMKGMGGKEQEKTGFKASGTLKRSDFGIGTIPVVVVSDEIELKVTGEFTKQDASATAEKK